MNKKRFIPLLVPLITLFINEVFLLYPRLFFVCLSLGALVIFFGVKFLGQNNKKEFWPLFSLMPIITFLSFSLYASLILSPAFIQIFFLAAFVINFYYFKIIYYYLFKDEEEQEEQLRPFFTLAGFFSVFCFYSSIYLLPLFINISPFFLALSPIIVVYFLFFQGIYFYSNSAKESFLIVSINTLILLQSSLILSYFPLSPHILGFIVALGYYLLLTISILSFKNKISRQTLKWPLILVIVAVSALFLTARWF